MVFRRSLSAVRCASVAAVTAAAVAFVLVCLPALAECDNNGTESSAAAEVLDPMAGGLDTAEDRECGAAKGGKQNRGESPIDPMADGTGIAAKEEVMPSGGVQVGSGKEVGGASDSQTADSKGASKEAVELEPRINSESAEPESTEKEDEEKVAEENIRDEVVKEAVERATTPVDSGKVAADGLAASEKASQSELNRGIANVGKAEKLLNGDARSSRPNTNEEVLQLGPEDDLGEF